jgi:phosphomannomutase/phosphoglucomutase
MSIYRAYDIRGIFGKDITLDVSARIAKAFGTYVGGGRIAVGRDHRLSSEEIGGVFSAALNSTGCDAIDIGLVPTPILYFSTFHYTLSGGAMITASHNPAEYNGFKLCKGTKTLYGGQIQEIGRLVGSGEFSEGSGKTEAKNVVPDYLSYVEERISLKRKLKVVMDAGNGTCGKIGPQLFRNLGCEVVELYCDIDGSFPNHPPDPTVDANLQDLIKKVREEKADIGIAYDGDGDRVGFVDESGGVLRGDMSLALFSRDILKDRKGANIIFEVKCSQALMEDIEKHGGNPVMYRTGHSFIKKKMAEIDSPLAGEMSGHFFFADDYYGYDDGLFASARMSQILANSGKKLSELVADIPKYFSTPEIRLHCADDKKFGVVERVTETFKKTYDVITVDGARLQFDDGWGLVRASNTQPALILRFEAKTKKRLSEIRAIVQSELEKYPEVEKKW